ncbi:hypothetical protein ACVWWG_001771 [Bradyrhizobium sp. LB7.2]
MALGIRDACRAGVFELARGCWNDGECVLRCDVLAQMIGVIGGIGDDDVGGQSLAQCAYLGCIALLVAWNVNRTGPRTARCILISSRRASARLLDLKPPVFAPRRAAPARWWNRRSIYEVRIGHRLEDPLANYLGTPSTETPECAVPVRKIKPGRARTRDPEHTFTNIRLSRPFEPFWSGRPLSSGVPCAPGRIRTTPKDPSRPRPGPKKKP